MRLPALLLTTTFFFSALLGASCATSGPPLPLGARAAMAAAAAAEKVRLGSSPPSCHSKCNACSPCAAVQVPTTAGAAGRAPPLVVAFSDYKPLGWKCQCGDRLYDP